MRQQDERKSGLRSAMDEIRRDDDQYEQAEPRPVQRTAETPEFVGPDEAAELFGQHSTRKQQFVGHASPGNRYNIGSQEEERVSPQTHLNNFMVAPEGTEVLDQAAELKESKQPQRKLVNPKHGQAVASSLSLDPMGDDRMGMLR